MAAMIGIAVETVSRMIAEFKRQSLLVETHPNRFLLDIRNLSVDFATASGQFRAVDGVDALEVFAEQRGAGIHGLSLTLKHGIHLFFHHRRLFLAIGHVPNTGFLAGQVDKEKVAKHWKAFLKKSKNHPAASAVRPARHPRRSAGPR